MTPDQKMVCAELLLRVKEIKELAPGVPARRDYLKALEKYGGSKHLPDEWRQTNDRDRIHQNASIPIMLKVWYHLLDASPAGMLDANKTRLLPRQARDEPAGGGAAAGPVAQALPKPAMLVPCSSLDSPGKPTRVHLVFRLPPNY